MSILTVIFSEHINNSAMSSPVEGVAVAMLSLGLVGIVATLLAVWKAKQARNKNTDATLARA